MNVLVSSFRSAEDKNIKKYINQTWKLKAVKEVPLICTTYASFHRTAMRGAE